jgi:hypothetical protein
MACLGWQSVLGSLLLLDKIPPSISSSATLASNNEQTQCTQSLKQYQQHSKHTYLFSNNSSHVEFY